MIGWIALSPARPRRLNAIVGEARRRQIVFNIVFAAFAFIGDFSGVAARVVKAREHVQDVGTSSVGHRFK
jgi:hypothetical protein